MTSGERCVLVFDREELIGTTHNRIVDKVHSKRQRFIDEQIVAIVNEIATMTNARGVLRRSGIATSTVYPRKAKYIDMGVPQDKRLNSLKDEHTRPQCGWPNSKCRRRLASQSSSLNRLNFARLAAKADGAD